MQQLTKQKRDNLVGMNSNLPQNILAKCHLTLLKNVRLVRKKYVKIEWRG